MINSARNNSINFRMAGVAASPGIAIGDVYLLDRRRTTVVEYSIDRCAIEKEIEIFKAAVERSRQQLQAVQESLSQHTRTEHFYIIDTQLLILDDQMLLDGTIELIREQQVNASAALKQVMQRFSQVFDRIEDEYLRERGSDIELVGERILRNIRGKEQQPISSLEKKSVLVAHDLSPADTLQMDKNKVVGFVTDLGGRTSHTAILARSLGVPAVVGLENVTARVSSGSAVIVDGCSGTVIFNPCADTMQHYLEKKARYEFYQQQLHAYCELPAQTLDGRVISLKANLEFPEEAALAVHNGAAGVGLLRTEFMYMARQSPPCEEDQLAEFRTIIQQVAPHPVTIRTLDVGGDKFVEDICLKDEANPAMGLRSVRLSLREKKLFKIQMRAILRASAFGAVRLLFPMISGVSEVRECKAILADVMAELRAAGVDFDPQIEVGIMIETPSAVLLADLLAKEVDFFSVGTNDLIQYCLAVDRSNEHVAYLYEPLHPAILRALHLVALAAQRAGIRAGICGEMAAEPLCTAIVVAMGYTELSMNSAEIPRVKKMLRQWRAKDSEALLGQLLQFSTTAEVSAHLLATLKTYLPDADLDWDF